jgi:hypothetical protein
MVAAALGLFIPAAAMPSDGTAGASASATGLQFVPAPSATRVLDTRLTPGRGPIGSPEVSKGAFRGGEAQRVRLGVPQGATAAVINLAIFGLPGGAAGWAVAWTPGDPMPPTSNVNTGAESTDANLTVVEVDDDGAIDLMTSVDLDVIIDLVGWFVPTHGPVTQGRFQPLEPARLIDQRAPAAPGNEYEGTDATPPMSSPSARAWLTRIPVSGRGGVPEAADLVAITITAHASGPYGGFVTAYATGAERPQTSTLGFSSGTRANLALVPLGPDGSVDLFQQGNFRVLTVDVVGWFTGSDAAPGTDGLLHLVPPQRLADSRSGIGFDTLGTPGSAVLEPTSVPASADAVLQNVTYVSHDAGWVCATPSPWSGGTVSIQNADASEDRAATTLTQLGDGPEPRLRYCSQNSSDLVVDLLGWFD